MSLLIFFVVDGNPSCTTRRANLNEIESRIVNAVLKSAHVRTQPSESMCIRVLKEY